jgi:hypothetical protein
MRAHDPRWNRYIIGRISSRFSGTTDEIFQWAAVKWGCRTTCSAPSPT